MDRALFVVMLGYAPSVVVGTSVVFGVFDCAAMVLIVIRVAPVAIAVMRMRLLRRKNHRWVRGQPPRAARVLPHAGRCVRR